MHLNCLWIKLKFILLLNLFLSSDFLCWVRQRAGTVLTIPLRYFEMLELIHLYTQESVSSRTLVKTGWRNRLVFSFVLSRWKTYPNRCFPFLKLLMKVLEHMFRLDFHFHHSFFEDFIYSYLTLFFMKLNHDTVKAATKRLLNCFKSQPFW